MAALAATQITQAGVSGALAAASAGGDTCPIGDDVFLRFNNASGGSLTVTIDDPNSPAPPGATAFNPDDAIVVGAGLSVIVGPINNRFAQSSGLANITYSGVTSLTVGAFRL